MAIVGYGRLGRAIASYIANNEPKFHIVGIFDVKQIIQDIDDVEFKSAQIMTCKSLALSLIHISEPTRQAEISYAVFCLKKKKKENKKKKKK